MTRLDHPGLVERVHRRGNVQHQHPLGALAFNAVLVGGEGGFLAEIDDALAEIDGHGQVSGSWPAFGVGKGPDSEPAEQLRLLGREFLGAEDALGA